VWIAYVGRLESVKGYDFLLRAVETIHARHPHVRTFFVGAGAPVGRPAPAGVRFLGFRRDVYAVLKKMDIFCLPSLSEGLPNALMEAMSVGLACVASRVGGVVHLIEHDRSGLLVDRGDVDALAGAMELLVTDAALRVRFGGIARATIETRFSWDEIDGRYDDLLGGVIGKTVLQSQEINHSASDAPVSSRKL
jgi:glycosyltransferase involved in cell wall biosynthesis